MRGGFAATVIALLLGAPLVPAQAPSKPDLTLTADGPSGPLIVETTARTYSLHLTFSCSQEELLGGPGSEITTTFHPPAVAAFVAAQLYPTQASDLSAAPEKCTDGAVRHEAFSTLSIQLTSDAPAFVDQTAQVAVDVAQPRLDGATNHWGPRTVNVTFAADYSPRMEVLPSSSQLPAAGAGTTVVFPVIIRHSSNGASVLKVSMASAAGTPPLEFDPVPETTLAAGFANGTESQVDLRMRVPAAFYKGNTQYVFTAEFGLASEDPRGTTKAEQSLTLTVRTTKAERRSPLGLDVAFLAVVLAVAGVRMGRRGLT